MSNAEDILSDLMLSLPELKSFHSHDTKTYCLLDNIAKTVINELFSQHSSQNAKIDNFGVIDFPYVKMGAIDSVNLFGLDELIIFSFYWKNRDKYKKVADMGANIGLHSIMMARSGFDVTSYEPDPTHFSLLERNIKNNVAVGHPKLINKAISKNQGSLEFTRVLGNTTGSHLSGSKPSPYGELEKFTVAVDAFVPILQNSDLLKVDIEGHESVVLLETKKSDWLKSDAIVEISSPDSAEKVFTHLQKNSVNMFAQKKGWNKVLSIKDMPTSYKEGSLFISCKKDMPW